MPVEIERKFLVDDNSWKLQAGPPRRFCQGFVSRSDGNSVRVRRADTVAYVTIKGERDGIARPEYEYEVPVDEAEEMLETLCLRPLLEKLRYCVTVDNLVWEVDVYQGKAEGLIVAEVELDRVDQEFIPPSWIGMEVTRDLRYRNASIAKNGPP